MKIGINTFLFRSPFTNDSLGLLKQFSNWGFDVVELALEDPSHVDAKTFRSALADNNIKCSSVCAALGPGRDLRGSKQEQQDSMDYMKGLLDFMAEAGVPALIGPLYSAVGRAEVVERDEYKKQWDTVVGHLKNLAEYAGERNIRLAIEPLNRYETDFINTCAQVMQLVKDIDHDAAGVLLDTYHMNIEEKDSAKAIRQAGSKLFHFHACGCDRGTPGNDHINWVEIAKALKDVKYEQAAIIESFTTDVKVIAKAASIWRQFEPSQQDIAVKGLEFLRSRLH
jgi:D-psicose/D-tagatose/L-ribulose 3-epimerase